MPVQRPAVRASATNCFLIDDVLSDVDLIFRADVACRLWARCTMSARLIRELRMFVDVVLVRASRRGNVPEIFRATLECKAEGTWRLSNTSVFRLTHYA